MVRASEAMQSLIKSSLSSPLLLLLLSQRPLSNTTRKLSPAQDVLLRRPPLQANPKPIFPALPPKHSPRHRLHSLTRVQLLLPAREVHHQALRRLRGRVVQSPLPDRHCALHPRRLGHLQLHPLGFQGSQILLEQTAGPDVHVGQLGALPPRARVRLSGVHAPEFLPGPRRPGLGWARSAENAGDAGLRLVDVFGAVWAGHCGLCRHGLGRHGLYARGWVGRRWIYGSFWSRWIGVHCGPESFLYALMSERTDEGLEPSIGVGDLDGSVCSMAIERLLFCRRWYCRLYTYFGCLGTTEHKKADCFSMLYGVCTDRYGIIGGKRRSAWHKHICIHINRVSNCRRAITFVTGSLMSELVVARK